MSAQSGRTTCEYAGAMSAAPEPIVGTMHIVLSDADLLDACRAFGVDVDSILDNPEGDPHGPALLDDRS